MPLPRVIAPLEPSVEAPLVSVIDPPVADTVLPADMSIAPETVLDDNEVKDIDGKLISLALAVEPVCNVILPASALKDVPVERSIAPDPNSLAALLAVKDPEEIPEPVVICLLYTSPSPRDATLSRMPSSA